jgi:hypothetical protein
MCSTARCSRCDKTTWRGCGQHVDQVMRNVPAAKRCSCAPAERPSLFGWLKRR